MHVTRKPMILILALLLCSGISISAQEVRPGPVKVAQEMANKQAAEVPKDAENIAKFYGAGQIIVPWYASGMIGVLIGIALSSGLRWFEELQRDAKAHRSN